MLECNLYDEEGFVFIFAFFKNFFSSVQHTAWQTRDLNMYL